MQKIMTRPGQKLVFADTGKPVIPGCVLRAVDPIGGPYVWHLDGHRIGADDHGHRVMVSRHHPKLGRVHRTFHPRVFGLTVVIDIVWYRDVRHTAHVVWAKGNDWLMAGIFALIPLAFFEHYHWADDITNMMSIFGGGDGH